jgi:hypothetical protein
MKTFITIIIAFVCSYCNAQFIRVYDLSRNKISNGKIAEITDSTIKLVNHAEYISVNEIGYIKTKVPAGLIVALSGLGGVVFGAATSTTDKFLPIEAHLILGGALGLFVGSIPLIFRTTEEFKINGNIDNWKNFSNN